MKEIQNEKKDDEKSELLLTTSSKPKFEYKNEFYGEFPYYIGIGTWSTQTSEKSNELQDKSLSFIESACIVSLLEDAIEELLVLSYVIGAPIIFWDTHYKTLEEKFTKRLSFERIFPEMDSKPVLTSSIKLQKDREQIEIVFYKMIKTLLDDGSFIPLTFVLDELQKEEEKKNLLIKELKANLLYLKDLTPKVEKKKRLDDFEEKGRDELLHRLQDEMDDIILKCDIEEKFLDKWENARNTQNQWKLRNIQNYYKENIAKLAIKLKQERRVTYELQLYLKTNQAELEEQLEGCMAIYDSEMERRENKILQMSFSLNQEKEKKHKLLHLYEDRIKAMKEWISFRNVRKLRKQASLQIQSWWRGIIVLKKIGPYKQKKAKAGEKLKKNKTKIIF